MNIAEKLTLPKGREINTEAIQVLLNRLGITKTALFIRENLFQKEDYLKLKEDLFGEKTAAEIFDEIKKGNF